MNPAKRAKIFERLREVNPHPTTELEFKMARGRSRRIARVAAE